MKDWHSLNNYLYDLPEELIAQYPCEPRDATRLLVVDRASGNMHEMVFHELADFLGKGDSLVFNNTKVLPSRLIGSRSSGGKAEIFLIKRLPTGDWEALVKPGKKLGKGSNVTFNEGFSCKIIDVLADGKRVVNFDYEGDITQALEKFGHVPLPPYMRRAAIPELDKERYQTVYAQHPGSVAAPTAGLHFTDKLLQRLEEKSVQVDKLTLHIGLGTFLPVKVEDIREHQMHDESFEISQETAERLNKRPINKRQICVGTTSCRALEAAASASGMITGGKYNTNIFIHPGYQFKYVQHLLTNFHQPGSSLLMLVSAFASPELIKEAYNKAIKERYRFLSYGDAMLIL
ncbi:S-adenosylmethionine:tRNA ribosyltransferase-isomerase [Neochlamydia sp. TUME1]|uniref:tRNA preQ1(34) S-adenosylmethionine ribosyltransferase-isomerase QueA n=1 Tax=Neochlamydia sp. TUME1 TaxID=1478174 RepID=UPI00057F04BD|nr:tRNA preQ1(34) S-adenosylmethionine ribosyltransferase-isomerase QueA [Neochlamydia sp. TUME1]KIC75097.1 S-adenosylmethionine:tRNA ribosyltransferase-isomerase [Neochlamydia sp. TUME1]